MAVSAGEVEIEVLIHVFSEGTMLRIVIDLYCFASAALPHCWFERNGEAIGWPLWKGGGGK